MGGGASAGGASAGGASAGGASAAAASGAAASVGIASDGATTGGTGTASCTLVVPSVPSPSVAARAPLVVTVGAAVKITLEVLAPRADPRPVPRNSGVLPLLRAVREAKVNRPD